MHLFRPHWRLLSVIVAWLLLASVAITVVPQALSALPNGLDACFFRDLNGSSTQGDSLNLGAAGEGAFTEPITVTLTDTTTVPQVSTTLNTDPVTGCVEFPTLTAGSNYQVGVIYPSEYYSSPLGGDTDITSGPPPSIAGDPFTGSYAFTYNAGDDVSITGGVSGLPELSLGYFITPSGDDMIETGTGPFDTTSNCPTQVPGDDCGTFDDVVRTNDVTTVGYTITADNIPDGNVNPLTNVILEQTITPNPGAVVEVPSLHPVCLTAGVTPASSITVDPATGVITAFCNLGSKDNGTSIVPMYIETKGDSDNGSSFTLDARVYTADDRAQVFDDSSTLGPEEIVVSAAPRFDITKGNDASNPFNRVVYFQTTERVNPITGVTEYGANYNWDISVIYDGGAKGQAALDGAITFSDIIPSQFSGWLLTSCSNLPYGAGNMPNDDRPVEDWGDRGDWSCAEDRANNEIDITVTNVDTDGDPIPTEGTAGNSLAAGPFIAFAGSLRIWYPLSDFYKSVDPTWTYGDPPITGDYNLENVVGNFDPVDSVGQSNFGSDDEPQENNDRNVNVSIRERGGFSKHLGSYEWADARIPDGSLTGTASTWPCGAASIAQGSLMSGQTQLCSSGDAPAQPGEKAHFWYWLRNDGTFPWASETVEVCDAFDNSTMSLTTWTGGETTYVRNGLSSASALIVEYATAGFNDDVAGTSWTNQLAAIRDCTAPNNDWSADPLSFDADPTTSLEMIGMVRIRVDETIAAEVLPSQYFQVSLPVEIRDTFNGGPNDGQPIPVGTILANNANRQFGTNLYPATFMDPETYTNAAWGDRLILNRHQVRVSKATSLDPTSPTNDDLFNVQGSDTVVWWLQPAVTAVTAAIATNVQVIDTLPAGVSFDPLCQAGQAYPDANVTLTSVTNNADGTTTLLFDLGDRPTNDPIGPIPVCTTVDNFIDPGTDLTNTVEITSDGDVSPESTRSDVRTVSVVASGELQLAKSVDAPLELQLDTQTYTIGWSNLSSDFDFSPPDVIDVWPYNGDGTNPLNLRTEFDSNYSGSYELTSWMPPPTTTLADGSTAATTGVWYYSADDPATIPYDADHPANDLTTGTVTWCTQAELGAGIAPCDYTFSDSSAVRFIQSEVLVAKSTVTVSYTFQAGTVADPNQPANRYVNRFAARTDSVDDLIRSNEVLVQVLSMNLGDLVFLDADVDGAFTAGIDVPIQGTVVELWQDDGTGTFTFVSSTTTNADGRYVFDDLLEATYEVRIPDAELSGGTLDTWTQTINPQPANNDDNEDLDQQAFDSGFGYTSSGPVTLSANTVFDPPIGLEPTGENVFNLGNPYTFDNLSNMSVDLGFRGDPAIQIVKEVCDTTVGSCDPSTPALDPSDGWVETAEIAFTNTATWRITVINIGDEMLTNVVIDDDIENDCDQTAAAVGDLGIGASFSYTCETTNVLVDLLNTAAVTAEGIGSGVRVEDDDSAAVETPGTDPDIAVTKYVNGDDAQTAPGILLDPLDAVTFTYEVDLNGGSVPLSNVTVDDDAGTPLDPADDWTATYVSGDTDSDNRLDIGETWLFEYTGETAIAGQYANWAQAEGDPVAPGSSRVSDTDPAHYFGSASGIELVKAVNGDDAQTAPGASIATGSALTFTYTVTNTGNIALDVTGLVDDAGTPADPADDWTPTFLNGDTNGDTLLDTSETWTYEWVGEIAANGPYANLAEVTAQDPIGNQVVDDDPANYFGSGPAITLEKATNTVDADVDPVLIEANAPITWTYVLTNTGNVPLSNTTVVDDNGTSADPADDFMPTLVSGDTDLDGVLDVNEVWTFEATGTATEESYTNNAEANGTGPSTLDEDGNTVPGETVDAEDPSSYYGSDPAIAVTKLTNGSDHPTGTGPHITVGDAVTWTYEVTNPGNIALSNVAVVDDNGTPTNPADDLTATLVSGDTNGNTLLDTTETWIFEATGTAIADQYVNEAVVSGTPPDVTNPDGTTSTPNPVTNDDDDRYYGSDPAIAVTKLTNGSDHPTGTGPHITVGDAVTWTYEVTNPGNIALSNVAVVDDNGTPTNPADDLTATLVSGDTNGNTLLDTTETWIFEATGTAIADQYVNEAVVSGTPPDVTNPDGTTSTPNPVTNDDDDRYYGSDPAIDITKATNGIDNTAGPGIFITPGDPVVWTYTVVNPGNVPLSSVVVVDDNGTPADPADDVTATLVSGDDNGDTILDTNETWIFEATGVAVAGQYLNEAEVTGTPPDVTNPDGTTSTPDPVTADDEDFYFGSGPAVRIVKSTNSVDNTEAPGVLIAPGDVVTWSYSVTNPGDVELSNVVVTDYNGTPTDPADDFAATLISGDVDGDTRLDTNETWIFEATGVATAGQYENDAVVSGTPPDVTNPDGTTSTPDPVGHNDNDFYYGSDPAIAVTKLTNGTDHPTGTGPYITVGDAVTWTYEVTNPGNIALSNVAVVDDNGTPADPTDDLTATLVSGDTNGNTLLDVGETWIFEATGVATAGQYENDAVVSGTPPDETAPDGTTSTPDPSTDNDDDRYYGSDAGISIVKAVNGDDANTAPGLLVPVGNSVSWTYTVTNTGNAPLIDLAVIDDQGVVVTCETTVLDPGQSLECTSEAQDAELGAYVNIGSVTGQPAEPCACPDTDGYRPILDTIGEPVPSINDNDPAHHFGTGPGIAIDKTVCNLNDITRCDITNEGHWVDSTVVPAGDDAQWRIIVTNTGNVDLVDVEVSDPLVSDCDRTVGDLAIGETITFSCDLIDVAGAMTNTASVSGVPAVGTDSPVTASDIAETLEPAELELGKSVDSRDVESGDRVTYVLTMSNEGAIDATNVAVLDSLPAGLANIEIPDGAPLTYDSATHALTWTVESLPVGETVTVSYSAEAEAYGSLVNVVEIISEHEERNLDNNIDEVSISVRPPTRPPLALTGVNSATMVLFALMLVAVGLTMGTFAQIFRPRTPTGSRKRR